MAARVGTPVRFELLAGYIGRFSSGITTKGDAMRLKDPRRCEPEGFVVRAMRGACIGNTIAVDRPTEKSLYLYVSGRGGDRNYTWYSRSERGFRIVLRRKGTG